MELVTVLALRLLSTAVTPTFPALLHLAFPARAMLYQHMPLASGSTTVALVYIILSPTSLEPLTLLPKSCWAPKANPLHLYCLFPSLTCYFPPLFSWKINTLHNLTGLLDLV